MSPDSSKKAQSLGPSHPITSSLDDLKRPSVPSMSLVGVSLEEHNLCITLDSERNRNALSTRLLEELCATFKNPLPEGARAVILKAKGSTFCSGHDFNDLYEIKEPAAEALFKSSSKLMQQIRALDLPVVAQVEGGAIGAGCQLALCCDFVVASETAFFQTPGGGKGWFCFTPMVELCQSLSSKRALEMLMSGVPISSKKAYEWGMINRVVPAADLEVATRQFTSIISQGDSRMLARGKKAFYHIKDSAYPDQYNYAIQEMSQTAPLPSAQTRIAKFFNQEDDS